MCGAKRVPDRGVMRSNPRQPAFSLLELVLVVAIIAILASMAVPRYGHAVLRYRADAAARRVVADLEVARKRAIHAGAARTVSFDAAADSYQLAGMMDPVRPSLPYVVSLGDEPYGATIVSVDFGGETQVTFDAYGLPVGEKGSGGVVVQVGGEARKIVVDSQTGEASIQ